MNNSVRRITDGAMMIAIVGALLLIDRQLGNSLAYTFMFVLPLPMVFYTTKYGAKSSIPVMIAMVLISFIVSTPQTVFYIAGESLIGLIYGNGIKKNTSQGKLIIVTMLIASIIQIVDLVLLGALLGYGLKEQAIELENMLMTAFETANVVVPENMFTGQFLTTIIVVSSAFLGVLQGYVTHMLSRILLKRLHFNVAPPQSLFEYYPPKWMGYVALLFTILYYYTVSNPVENEILQSVLQTLGVIGFIFLVCMGFIFMILFLRLQFPRAKGLVIIIALFLFLTMPMVLIFSGFLYITTDTHRKIMEGGLQNAKKG